MQDDKYMQIAIDVAKQSQEPTPCGVVIVREDQIIARAFNSHHIDHNATAHAEIKAIVQAGKFLGNKNLHGCSAYCTCEPCTMCASALFYAEVDRIVYGVTMADIDPGNTRIMLTIEELITHKQSHPEIVGGCLRNECLQELYSQ
jgi:tRNA(Arg) A34 adenosine deaminase TadA